MPGYSDKRLAYKQLGGDPDKQKNASEELQKLAMMLAAAPGVGDAVGVAADVDDMRQNGVTPMATLSMLLGALPFVPSGIGRMTRRTQDINKAMKVKRASLTPTENKYFKEIFESPADRKELLERVPGAKFDGKQLEIPRGQEKALADYVDETWALTQKTAGGPGTSTLPPSFQRGKFAEKF